MLYIKDSFPDLLIKSRILIKFNEFKSLLKSIYIHLVVKLREIKAKHYIYKF